MVIESKACSTTFQGHTSPVYSLCKMNEDEFISGSGDTTIRLWSLKTKLALLHSKETFSYVSSHCKMNEMSYF